MADAAGADIFRGATLAALAMDAAVVDERHAGGDLLLVLGRVVVVHPLLVVPSVRGIEHDVVVHQDQRALSD